MLDNLHIICLEPPYPVRHGGHYDMYYKLVALHQEKINIHLHCFGRRNGGHDQLLQYCSTVNYYPRRKGISLSIPYIVYSRRSDTLVQRLLKDDFPILAEGIHCTGWLSDKRFEGRKILVRLHNVEHRYYQNLYISSSNIFKKLYYFFEARLLRNYEARIAPIPDAYLAVSELDEKFYASEYGVKKITTVPVFIPLRTPIVPAGVGNYCLYHGNLSVPENQKAVDWLIDEVFDGLDVPLVVAGMNPPPFLRAKIQRSNRVTLVSNPADDELRSLIAEAQCHVLPSVNNTGVKLKIINVLFAGRHCIVNRQAVSGSGLDALCIIADDAGEFRRAVQNLYSQPVDDHCKMARNEILKELFTNSANAKKIIQLLS